MGSLSASMGLRLFLLGLASTAAIAQMEPMSGMGMATWTEAGMASTMTSIPSAIMPSDISANMIFGSTTPTTLVMDTMTPPVPSSSVAWAMTSSGDMMTSGVAMSTGSSSASAGSTGEATVNGTGSVYNKISMGLLALCIVASAAAQM